MCACIFTWFALTPYCVFVFVSLFIFPFACIFNYAAHLQISAEIFIHEGFKSLRVADLELTLLSLFLFSAVVRSPLRAEHHHRGRRGGGAAAL